MLKEKRNEPVILMRSPFLDILWVYRSLFDSNYNKYIKEINYCATVFFLFDCWYFDHIDIICYFSIYFHITRYLFVTRRTENFALLLIYAKYFCDSKASSFLSVFFFSFFRETEAAGVIQMKKIFLFFFL